jgi:hypothetical protein
VALLPAEYAAQRASIALILEAMRRAPAPETAQHVAAAILRLETETTNSQFLMVDGDPHLFSAFTRKLLPLSHGDPRWATHLLMVYGLNTKDREITPKVTQALASYAMYNGRKTTIRRWAAYCDGALYLSRYDGTMYRVTGAGVVEGPSAFLIDDAWQRRLGRSDLTPGPIGIDIIDNGRPVLFADDDNGAVPLEPVIGRNGQLFKLLQGVTWALDTGGHMRPKHQVQALMIWMLAVAFSDLFPTKPLLMVEGAPGSGKTTILQMIQQALFGSVDPFTVSKDGLRDFWVTLLHSPIMVLDNPDDPIDWLADNVCAYCTKGYRAERKLHTNTGRVEIRPQSFIAVASKDPRSFRRDDVVDRSIVLRLGPRTARGSEGAAALAAHIEHRRAEIFGEWLYYLNRVVAALAVEPPRRTTTRLGDFEVFAYAACRALGWQSSVVVPNLLDALARERTAFAAESDIVLDILADWTAFGPNTTRWVTVQELFRDLSTMATTANRPFVKTPQALAQRLRAPHLRVLYEVDETLEGEQRRYAIRRRVTSGETALN